MIGLRGRGRRRRPGKFFVGQFLTRTATGVQQIHNLPWTPTGMMFFTSGSDGNGGFDGVRACIGMVSFTDLFLVNKSRSVEITDNEDHSAVHAPGSAQFVKAFWLGDSAGNSAQATVTALQSGGFALNYTSVLARSQLITFIAFGPGVNVASGSDNGRTTADGTGTKVHTIPGTAWTPEAVFLAATTIGSEGSTTNYAGYSFGVATPSNQWGMAVRTDPLSPANSRRRFNDDFVLGNYVGGGDTFIDVAAFSAMGAGSFTLTWSPVTFFGLRFTYLALDGISAAVGTFTGGLGASQSITSPGFRPQALMLASAAMLKSASAVAGISWAMGVTDSVAEACDYWTDQDNVTPSNVRSTALPNRLIQVADHAHATLAIARLLQMTSTGFDLSWLDNDDTVTHGYVALGGT